MPLPPRDHELMNWLKTKASNRFWPLTPTCAEVVRLTSEGRDRPLPMGMRMRLSLHRAFCKWCARYAKQLDFLHKASARFPEQLDVIGSPTLGDGAKARMKRALGETQG